MQDLLQKGQFYVALKTLIEDIVTQAGFTRGEETQCRFRKQ